MGYYNSVELLKSLFSLSNESVVCGVFSSLIYFPAPNTPVLESAQLLTTTQKCTDLQKGHWNRADGQVREYPSMLIKGQKSIYKRTRNAFHDILDVCIFLLATFKFKGCFLWHEVELHNWFTLVLLRN